MDPTATVFAFLGDQRLSSGPWAEVEALVRAKLREGTSALLVFDAATGKVVDVDLREPAEAPEEPRRGPGRPKLGVVAREVTLLPRHWEWLQAQPGGASVALRRLVDEARRAGVSPKQRQEAAYRFMSAMAGDRAGFEEASRALFAGDRAKLEQEAASWPPDIREHVLVLAFG